MRPKNNVKSSSYDHTMIAWTRYLPSILKALSIPNAHAPMSPSSFSFPAHTQTHSNGLCSIPNVASLRYSSRTLPSRLALLVLVSLPVLRREAVLVHLEELLWLLGMIARDVDERRRGDVVGLAFAHEAVVLEEILQLAGIAVTLCLYECQS